MSAGFQLLPFTNKGELNFYEFLECMKGIHEVYIALKAKEYSQELSDAVSHLQV
jgi:hypothetical protein